MTTFGEISWGDDIYGDAEKKPSAGKDLFLRLEEGSNEMRLVTQPHQYLVHKVKRDPNNPKDFGQKVYCSAVHGDCPVCKMDPENKAKTRWLLGVISRKTGAYKILDISYAVFAQIRKLNKSSKWGDPTKYDIDVVVSKNEPPQSYYTVQPLPKEPLSASDQQIKDNVDLDDLKRRVTPPTPENVQKRLNKVLGLDDGTATTSMAAHTTKTNASTSKKAAPVAKVEMNGTDDSSELDTVFPDYDSQN